MKKALHKSIYKTEPNYEISLIKKQLSKQYIKVML